MSVDTCMHACMCVYMFMRICVSVHACASTLVHVCMCKCVGVCLPAHQGEENQPCVSTCDVQVFYTHCSLFPATLSFWCYYYCCRCCCFGGRTLGLASVTSPVYGCTRGQSRPSQPTLHLRPDSTPGDTFLSHIQELKHASAL